MRPGGGKDKGSAFERSVCVALSLWLTDGDQSDLFTRNVLSGGRFTIMHGRGDAGIPGDIAAAHPLAYHFLQHFLVECKHYKELRIGELILKGLKQSFLGQVYLKAEAQAALTGRAAMIIAKQNNAAPIVVFGATAGRRLLDMQAGRRLSILHHSLHNGKIYIFYLADIISLVSAAQLVVAMEPIKI